MKEQTDYRRYEWTPPPEFCISTPRPMKWTKAGVANLVLAFLIGFLGFGVVGAVYDAANRDHRLKDEGKEIDGVVKRTWTEDLRTIHYHVAYEFPAAGKTVQGEAELSKRKWQALSRGVSIPVKYVPSDPEINQPAVAYARLTPYWVPLAVFLGWIGMLSLAMFPIRKERRLLRYGQAAAGVVTNTSKGIRPKYGYIGKYEFQLPDGTTIKGKTQRDRTFHAGGRVCIVYDPKRPRRNDIYPLRLARIIQ
jgi:hypothetical protein